MRNIFHIYFLAQVFSSCLRTSGRTGIIASEEEDIPVAVEESYSGNYIVVFDPLDGSSNIDAAVSTGSIFGIYKPNEECLTNLGDSPTVSIYLIRGPSPLCPACLETADRRNCLLKPSPVHTQCAILFCVAITKLPCKILM
jgi:fructose-1,6-bisphosphatase